MRHKNYFYFSSFIFFFLFSLTVFSQTGTVKGTLLDASKSPVIGASVLLEGTSLGAATDVDGNFIISKVPTGIYNVVINYIGYKSSKVNGITVESGKITLLNTTLEEESQSLNEVVVVGTRSSNTEVAVISEIKEAQQVVSGISAEQIIKSQDRDAAEVVRRIPGVTVVDNKFINIRGLNERYNTVWVNDAVAPSSETDRKSFSFDIIPSNLLDRVLIFKTASPELPGDFAGGMVKVYTRKPSYNERSLTISLTEGFRAGTTFKSFASDAKGNMDWLGFGGNNNIRKLPDNLTLSSNGTGNLISSSAQKFVNNYGLTRNNAIPDQRFNVSYLTGFKIGEKSFGSLSAITYSNTFTNYNINRFNFVENQYFKDSQYTNNVRLGALQNFSFSLANGGKIEFRNMFNQISRNQVTERVKYSSEDYITKAGFGYSEGYQSRMVYNGQLAGDHNLHLIGGETTINWVLGYSKSNKKEPDLRRTQFGADSSLATQVQTVDLNNSSRLFQNLDENIYSLNLAVKHKFSEKVEFNFGTYIENKDRTFVAELYGFILPTNLSPEKEYLRKLPIDQIFNPNNVNTNPEGSPANGFVVGVDSKSIQQVSGIKPDYSYDAKNRLAAGYASFNFNLDNLKILAGARFEHNVQSIVAGIERKAVTPSITTDKILPSTNISYNFSEKQLVRFAYGRTLNRPEFREWAPFIYYDFDINANVEGSLAYDRENPLKVADINNFDLRYEIYPSDGENIHFGLFYKTFKNPIEASVINTSNLAYTFVNANRAKTYGVELDVRKKLGSIDMSLKNFTIVLNASLIKSRVDVNATDSWTANRKLQGQSPYVINTGIYYNNDKKGFQVSALYNVFGQRIIYIGSQTNSETVEMPRNTIDITITKTVFKEKLAISLGVSDLLNQRVLMLLDDPNHKDNKYTRNSSDPKFVDYRRGSYYTFGLRYSIF